MKVKKSEPLFTSEEITSYGISTGIQYGAASTRYQPIEPLHSIQKKFEGFGADQFEEVFNASGWPLETEIPIVHQWRSTIFNFLPHSKAAKVVTDYLQFLQDKQRQLLMEKQLERAKADLERLKMENTTLEAAAKPCSDNIFDEWDYKCVLLFESLLREIQEKSVIREYQVIYSAYKLNRNPNSFRQAYLRWPKEIPVDMKIFKKNPATQRQTLSNLQLINGSLDKALSSAEIILNESQLQEFKTMLSSRIVSMVQ